jgi:selenide,water dikinase
MRLTKLAKRAGCAAKHPPGYLLPLLARLPEVRDPNVLVGAATADDAAVYKLSDELAIVTTTDFFTPIVDGAYEFGAIAAANALSDVYAMGGAPRCALNIVGFPDSVDQETLAEILRGGAEKAAEAGIDIVGGHTIQTDEPIYGLAVTGTIDPRRVLTNATAKDGDLLVLTKPIGVGIISTAAKRDEDDDDAIGEAITLMSTLNRAACDAMLASRAHAATDITGFGLLGHLRNVVAASRLGATVWLDRVPILAAARRYCARGIVPGGTHANRRALSGIVDFDGVEEIDQLLLCDAQTSGGLLIAIAPGDVEELLRELRARGTPAAAIIGALHADRAGRVRVVSEAP